MGRKCEDCYYFRWLAEMGGECLHCVLDPTNDKLLNEKGDNMWKKTCKNCYYNKYPTEGYLKCMHCILKPENAVGVLNFKSIEEEKEMKKYKINMQMTVDFETTVDAQNAKDAKEQAIRLRNEVVFKTDTNCITPGGCNVRSKYGSVWNCKATSMTTNEIPAKRPLILLCGKSGSGKTTVAKLLCRTYGLNQVWSYTTRTRRSNIDSGHIFVSEELFEQHEKEGIIVADATINGYKYWATKEQLDRASVYVIDPKTALELAEKIKDEREVIIVYLTCPETTRVYRMAKRGDRLEDINTRLLIENNWDDYIATINHLRQRYDSGHDDAETIVKAIMSIYNFCLSDIWR